MASCLVFIKGSTHRFTKNEMNERRSQCTCEEGKGVVSGEKGKKERTNQSGLQSSQRKMEKKFWQTRKKNEKGQCGTVHPRTRRETTSCASHPRTRQGKGHVPEQGKGRWRWVAEEGWGRGTQGATQQRRQRATRCMAKGRAGDMWEKGSSQRMKKKRRKIKENTPGAASCHAFVSKGCGIVKNPSQRKAKGEGHGRRRNNGNEGQHDAWQRDKQVRYMWEKEEQSANEKEKEKENAPGAVSRHAFVSERAPHREKTSPPRVCKREGVPYALSESQRKKEKKEGGASQSEGTSQSEVRGKALAHPRAMWRRVHVPKRGAKGRGRCRVAEKGNGDDLESFINDWLTVRVWELPKSAMSSSHFSHSPLLPLFSPHQQQLFHTANGRLLFYSFSFPLTFSLFLQVHRTPLAHNVSRGYPLFKSTCMCLCHPVCPFLFSFSPPPTPFPLQVHWDPLSFTNAGGSHLSWIYTHRVFCHECKARRHSQLVHLFFFYFFFIHWSPSHPSFLPLQHLVTSFITPRLPLSLPSRPPHSPPCTLPLHYTSLPLWHMSCAFITWCIVPLPLHHTSPDRIVPHVPPQRVPSMLCFICRSILSC